MDIGFYLCSSYTNMWAYVCTRWDGGAFVPLLGWFLYFFSLLH